MARYGRFKYGAAKYGATTGDSLAWWVEVDWDGDGSYGSGTNEAYWLRGMLARRGRWNYVKVDGSGFEQALAGTISLTFDNQDGRYDPYNASSPIYPNVTPGRRIKVRVKDNNTGTIYDVFEGNITDIQPVSESDERVIITGVDGMAWLAGVAYGGTIYSSSAVSSIISGILTAAGWTRGSTVEDNLDEVPTWWALDKTCLQAIQETAEAFMGQAFVAADGDFVFYSRHHIGTAVTTISQDELRRNIALPRPWEVVRNYIEVVSRPRRTYAGVEIWRLQDTVYMGAGDSVEIWANYVYNTEMVPARNVVTPAATTDYTMNSSSDGTGTDLTSSFTVGIDKFATTAKLTITNGGSTPGYVTLLKLRGDALSSLNTATVVREDATSQATHGKRRLRLDSIYLQDALLATDFANFLKSFLANPQVYPLVELEDRPDIQFLLELFDVATLSIPKKTISGDFVAAGIEHEWLGESGQEVVTRIRFEPEMDLSSYWIFTAEIGVTTRFGF